MILEHSQASCGLELLSFKWDEVSFHVFDFLIHLIFDFIGGLDFLPFLISDLSEFVGFFDLDFLPQFLSFLFKLVPLTHVKFVLWKLAFVLGDFEVVIFFCLFKFFDSALLFIDLIKGKVRRLFSRDLILFYCCLLSISRRVFSWLRVKRRF